jgi:hypothetical protein
VDVVVDFKDLEAYFREAIVFNMITSAFQQHANVIRIHKLEKCSVHTAGVLSRFLFRVKQRGVVAKLRRQQNCCKALVQGQSFRTEEKVSGLQV